MLVHHVTRHLDKATMEAWETSLGASQEYPTYHQLETFLTARVRALERIETAVASPAKPQPTSAKRPALAHHVSSQPSTSSSSTTFPCDFCHDPRFIVMCTKFRNLSPADRYEWVVHKRLCYNCLGRHNVRSCKATRSCKTCSGRHHTMLHGTPQLFTSTQSTSQSAH
ncbi:hypothetical protein KPH14_012809 [Odynerus spinipes]|uniref:Uncharacterized protein n=1 Tax=Odynerus spinipes TaxID=1348599 RepID=A0AAD9RDJ4_9HYME|nr:hypothetical protein KPH14_012809 [Odynerus spinipes]